MSFIPLARSLIFLFILISFEQADASEAFIDIHSHVFMKHGLGPLFHGKFDDKLKATSWNQMLKSKVNKETLISSNAPLVVVALYAHPVFAPKVGLKVSNWMKEGIQRQINEAKNFVKENPTWIIATSASQARNAIDVGKRVLVLSLEGAHGIFEDDSDFDRFIENEGISIVTPVHLINNDYGGAAYMRGFRKTIFSSKVFSRVKAENVKINPVGIKKKGHKLIEKLIKRKVWIDLSHASDRFQWEAIPLMRDHKMPLLYTHVSLRKFYKAERGLADWAIMEIKRHGGFVGLVPSEEMVVDTPTQDSCKGGLKALAVHYNELAKEIGPTSIALGSDFNGGIPHIAPHKCGDLGSLSQDGLKSAAQWPLLWQGLKDNGAHLPNNSKEILDEFLYQWSKVRP